MRILAFDVETTGLDPTCDVIIELGWVLWDTDRALPLLTGGGIIARGIDDPPITDEIEELTGITRADMAEFGRPIDAVLDEMGNVIIRHDIEWLAAHNAPFDMSFLTTAADYLPGSAIQTALARVRVIDTQRDLPFRKGATGRRLVHALADIGIVQQIRHRALTDAMSCALLLQHYPIEETVHSAISPTVTLRAHVTYEQNDLAKARGYRWDGNGKRWVKELKDFMVAAEQAEAPFRTTVCTNTR